MNKHVIRLALETLLILAIWKGLWWALPLTATLFIVFSELMAVLIGKILAKEKE